jgi:hypothetical protein
VKNSSFIQDIKYMILESDDSYFSLNNNIKSHVWVNGESGIRDLLNSSENYRSLDMFVKIKDSMNFNFLNIDLQIRSNLDQVRINNTNANHNFYKSKNIYKFILNYFFDKTFRMEILKSLNDFLVEVETLENISFKSINFPFSTLNFLMNI